MSVDKISSTFFQVKNLICRVHVKLHHERKNFGRQEVIDVFDFNNTKYMKIEPTGYISMELKFFEEEWSMDKSIMITESNIFKILRGIKTIINNIYDGGLFAVDKRGTVILYASEVEKNSVRVEHIGGTNSLEFIPCIVLDENSLTYEGCRMFINRRDNYIDLNIDQLESIYYVFSNINIYQYKMSILNVYFSYLSSLNGKDMKEAVTLTKNFAKKAVTNIGGIPKIFNTSIRESNKSKSNEEFFNMTEEGDT